MQGHFGISARPRPYSEPLRVAQQREITGAGEIRQKLRAVKMRDPNPTLLLRVEEAAERLAVSRTTLYGLLASGALPSVHIGRSVRVSVAALEAYVAGLALAPD